MDINFSLFRACSVVIMRNFYLFFIILFFIVRGKVGPIYERKSKKSDGNFSYVTVKKLISRDEKSKSNMLLVISNLKIAKFLAKVIFYYHNLK